MDVTVVTEIRKIRVELFKSSMLNLHHVSMHKIQDESYVLWRLSRVAMSNIANEASRRRLWT